MNAPGHSFWCNCHACLAAEMGGRRNIPPPKTEPKPEPKPAPKGLWGWLKFMFRPYPPPGCVILTNSEAFKVRYPGGAEGFAHDSYYYACCLAWDVMKPKLKPKWVEVTK